MNPRFRNLDCKTNEDIIVFGQPGDNLAFVEERDRLTQITFISEHPYGLPTVMSVASLQQSYS